eukprot:2884493-Pleurochrysis_carterae.AAC.1
MSSLRRSHRTPPRHNRPHRVPRLAMAAERPRTGPIPPSSREILPRPIPLAAIHTPRSSPKPRSSVPWPVPRSHEPRFRMPPRPARPRRLCALLR